MRYLKRRFKEIVIKQNNFDKGFTKICLAWNLKLFV